MSFHIKSLVARDLFAHLPQIRKVLSVDGKFVNRHVVGGIFGMRPSQDGVGRGMQDVLGVGSSEVGGKGDVEGVMNWLLHDRRLVHRHSSLTGDFLVVVHARHRDMLSGGHAKVGPHALGPLTHICKLIHVGILGIVGITGRLNAFEKGKNNERRWVFLAGGRPREPMRGKRQEIVPRKEPKTKGE